jgi:hypothetical protein
MAKAFARSFAIFCIALGLIYGAEKLFGAPVEFFYLAPTVALVYLGSDILVNNWTTGKKRKGRGNEKGRSGTRSG